MTCEELLERLNEYVDGGVNPEICKDFERHLAGCNPCQVVVDTIRGTITLYRDGAPVGLPVEFRDRLRRVVREKWEASHPDSRSRD